MGLIPGGTVGGGGGGGVSDGDKGDVIVSGSGTVWTLDPSGLTSLGVKIGQAIVDFGSGADSATVTVTDAGVLSGSRITLGLRVSSGRDSDELEVSPLQAVVSAINAGVSFVVSCFCIQPDDFADGTFLIDYVRGA